MERSMGNSKGTTGGMYKPSGAVQGDDSEMADKGTGTGVTNTYGANLGQSATNSRGAMTGTDSDGMEAA